MKITVNMWMLALAIVALLSVEGTECKSSQFLTRQKEKLENLLGTQGPGPQIGCIVEHCLTESIACVAESNCRNSIVCGKECLDQWDTDKTEEKLHIQNCSNKCAFSYADEVYEKLMSCYTNNECIKFPPIPSYCRANASTQTLKKLSLKDLSEGTWWVVRGLNAVYDCYPCQTIKISLVNSTLWRYNPQYKVYLVNGSLELVNQYIPIGSQPAGANNVSFVYHDVGLKHSETWWLLDEADDKSYMAMYYCGNTLQWNYEGALVWARNKTLSDGAYQKISSVYKSIVGYDLSSFCYVKNPDSCPNKY